MALVWGPDQSQITQNLVSNKLIARGQSDVLGVSALSEPNATFRLEEETSE